MRDFTSPFFGFSPGSFDEVAIAVKNTLKGNAKILDWAEAGIYRSDSPIYRSPSGGSSITVSIGSIDMTFKPSAQADTLCPILISCQWIQVARDGYEDNEATVAGLVEEVHRTLKNNYYLKDALFDNKRLVRRIERFDIIDLSSVEALSEDQAILRLVISVLYDLDLSSNTMRRRNA